MNNKQYKSYLLRVEVEKNGSKIRENSTIELVVQIYASNKAINTRSSIIGKTICLNGYIDTYLTNEGKIIPKLIAQNIYVVDRDKNDGVYSYYSDVVTIE